MKPTVTRRQRAAAPTELVGGYHSLQSERTWSALRVTSAHDEAISLHVRFLASGRHSTSAYVVVHGATTVHRSQEIVAKLSRLVEDRFGIEHVTLQIECAHHCVDDSATPCSLTFALRLDPCHSDDMSDRDVSVRYNEAVESFIEFARTLTADEWSTHVPCTPEWTARDVLSHVSGIPDDGFAGRTHGAATEPWTASQVERYAGFTVDELLTRWESQYQLFGTVINETGEQRPPFDCHSHEHDIRHAIGRPGHRDSAIVDDGVDVLLSGLSDVPVEIVVIFDDGTTVTAGQLGSEERVKLSTTKFEIFRSRLGRRTPDQVRALDWSGAHGSIDKVVSAWFEFGPSEIPIIE
jgi:uncharacterized protein (TIGR03083 family)